MPRTTSRRKKPPKRVLALPDLEQAKAAVLNSLTSASGQRTYDHAIREFVAWYCSEPRLAFNVSTGRHSMNRASATRVTRVALLAWRGFTSRSENNANCLRRTGSRRRGARGTEGQAQRAER